MDAHIQRTSKSKICYCLGRVHVFVQKTPQSSPIDLSEFEEDVRLMVYPNPSSTLFNIEFEVVDDAVLTVWDMHGKLVSTTAIQKSSKASVVLNESPGIYLLNIETIEGQKIVRIIKE